MKAKNNRRKKRGIKALFCFLLAAELTLGSLSTPAQAEASEITTPETEKGAEASEITTPETKAEEAAEPTDSTPPPEKTEGEPEANEQKQETTEPEEPNPPDTENTCICRSRCDNDNVNKECPVCAGGPDKCTYEAEEEPPAEEPPTEEPPLEEICTCTILCTGDNINAECPVCAENPSLCALAPQEETPVTVTEEAPQVQLLSDLEEEPNPLADEPQCICTKLCMYGNINDACLVCQAASYLCMTFQDETVDAPRLYYRKMEGGVVEVAQHPTHRSLTGSLTIPTTVSGYTVVGIGDDAFVSSKLTKITIPDSVTTIGNGAFLGCTNLQAITIPDSVTTIEDYAFLGCTGLGTIDIPGSVITIGDYAFKECTGLGTITIPDSVTEVGKEAFLGCTSLTSVKLSNQISVISQGTFQDCTSLWDIAIPGSVCKIGKQAFNNCQSLNTINIPDSVNSIGGQAFEGCSQLQTVDIGKGVNIAIDQIGSYVFRNCHALKKITIPNGIPRISESMFEGCSALERVTILNNSVSLGIHAFQNCTSLASLSLAVIKQDGLDTTTTATVDHSAQPFEGCPKLRYLTFVTEDGTELDESSELFQNAKTTYDEGDGKWQGWTIGKAPETPEPPVPATYAVTIQARLNGSLWNEFPWDESPWNESEHPKKTFALSKDNGNTYITDLAAVANGTYQIYEITETAARAVPYLDTGMTVVVEGKNPDTVYIDYYTATFYDGSVPYGNSTDQHSQIVLKNTGVVQPLPPNKSGFIFFEWKTEPNGNTPFDFANTTLNERNTPMRIYASWTTEAEEPKSYFITATAGEGGSISPEGNIAVTEGTDYTFTIQADTGYRIKSVIVDGRDRRALTSYTFTNVNSDGHTIEAVFEKTEPGGGDEPGPDTPGGGGDDTDPDTPGGGGGDTDPDNPGGGGGGTDPDNPGGGGGSDPDDSDDDHSGGGTSDSGSDAGGSGGGNSGGGTSDSGSDAGSSGGGNSGGGSDTGSSGGGNSGGSTDSTNLSAGSSLPEAGASAKAADTISNTNTNTNVSGSRPGEPKTGDASHLEVYASIAMIAGFVYLILYLMDGMKGMSEEEKNRRIAALLGWAKRGRAKTLRRYIAITAVFFVLAYYHAFGKQAALGWQKA